MKILLTAKYQEELTELKLPKYLSILTNSNSKK